MIQYITHINKNSDNIGISILASKKMMFPFVVGTVAFFYIKSYNRIARMYHESDRTLELKKVLLPVTSQ